MSTTIKFRKATILASTLVLMAAVTGCHKKAPAFH